jgi:hypothetical protein
MQLRLTLYLIKYGFVGLSHLFLAFHVLSVVLKCALSQVVWVLFVSFFDFIYLAQSSWNYINSHHTSCACGCVEREEVYCLQQSILMAKETKYFVISLC